jgi:3'(2'), 5'-bisphosphate nucleotidase
MNIILKLYEKNNLLNFTKKVLTVIDGLTDCYIYPKDGTKRWDTCAPEAIIRSLNGSLTDIFGNDYSYLKNSDTLVENIYGIVASLDKNNSYYTQFLSDELKDLVKQDAEKVKAAKIN